MKDRRLRGINPCFITFVVFEGYTEFHRERIMEINQITHKIIGCAIEVHKNLGPGLLESAYEECLTFEMRNSGLKVECQKPVPVVYKEKK